MLTLQKDEIKKINYEVKSSTIPILKEEIDKKKLKKKSSQKFKKKKKEKAKYYRLPLSFTVQCVWVNNNFFTPFNFYYSIKFNNMNFL